MTIYPSLSGGAIHSPQILMLSGIGPAVQLLQHNIQVILDAPGVGINLMDHSACSLRLKETTGMTFNHLTPYDLRTMCLFMRDFLRYQLWGTGPVASNVGQASLRSHSMLNNGIDR
jgi:choline dehydrogenase